MHRTSRIWSDTSSAKEPYHTFQKEFVLIHGSEWIEERDAFDFMRDEIAQALAIALKMRRVWFDESRDRYKINIENFAKLLREYLDTKGNDHRIIFLVDEVGQFIGNNTQLSIADHCRAVGELSATVAPGSS